MRLFLLFSWIAVTLVQGAPPPAPPPAPPNTAAPTTTTTAAPAPKPAKPAAPAVDPNDERQAQIKAATEGMPSGTWEKGAWIYGQYKLDIDDATTAKDCAAACEKETPCLHWTLKLDTRRCDLMQKGGGFDDSKDGWITGHSSRWYKKGEL